MVLQICLVLNKEVENNVLPPRTFFDSEFPAELKVMCFYSSAVTSAVTAVSSAKAHAINTRVLTSISISFAVMHGTALRHCWRVQSQQKKKIQECRFYQSINLEFFNGAPEEQSPLRNSHTYSKALIWSNIGTGDIMRFNQRRTQGAESMAHW